MTVVDGNFWNFFEGLKFGPNVCEQSRDSCICIREDCCSFCSFWCARFVFFKQTPQFRRFDREALVVHDFDTHIFTRIMRGCEEARAIVCINSGIVCHRCRADSVSVLWERLVESYHCHLQYSSTFHATKKFIY